jgi:hypothetical protein
MELFAPVFSFIIDKSNKKFQKALLITLSVLLLMFLDNVFGFTYYYNLNNKLDILSKIHSILKDNAVDTATKSKLTLLTTQILEHSSIKDKIWNLISYSDKPKGVQYIIYQYLTSSVFFIAVMIAGVFTTYKELTNPVKYILRKPLVIIKIYFFVELFLFATSIIVTWLLSLIPLIAGQVYYNYIANICLNGFIILVFNIFFSRIRKTDKQEVPSAPATPQRP